MVRRTALLAAAAAAVVAALMVTGADASAAAAVAAPDTNNAASNDAAAAIVLYDGALLDDGFAIPATGNHNATTSWLPVLRTAHNPLEAVTAALAARAGAPHRLSTIALVGHGAPGSLQLGSATINADTVAMHATALRTWAAAVVPGGELQLHGCETGRGVRGAALLAALSNATGLRVVAPTAVLRGASPSTWRLDASSSPGRRANAQQRQRAATMVHAVAAASRRVPALQIVLNTNFTRLNFTSFKLISGTALTKGALYRYTNIGKFGGNIVDCNVTLTNTSNVKDFTFDNNDNPPDFEPNIGFTASGFVDFTFAFQLQGTTKPVYLQNFILTGFDLDGGSSTEREFVEVGGFSAVTLAATTQITSPLAATIGCASWAWTPATAAETLSPRHHSRRALIAPSPSCPSVSATQLRPATLACLDSRSTPPTSLPAPSIPTRPPSPRFACSYARPPSLAPWEARHGRRAPTC